MRSNKLFFLESFWSFISFGDSTVAVNFGDSYYVMNYYTFAALMTICIVILGLCLFFCKMLFRRFS